MRRAPSILLLLVLTAGASAEPLRPPAKVRPRLGRALLEASGALLIGTAWYWANTDLNAEDWELRWDAESWRIKLSSEGIRFDTNAFDVNAVKHPFGTVVIYQAGRANGYGPFGSSVITLATSFVWEYLIEFKEIVSANDLVVNVASGLGLAEPLYQLGQHLREGRGTAARRVFGAIASPLDGLHDWLEERPRLEGARSWSRLRVTVGGGAARFEGVEREEVELGVDMAIARLPHVGRPIDHAGWTAAGAATRLTGRLHLGDADAGTPFLGTRIWTQTSLAGHHAQAFASPTTGWSRAVAIGSAFEYDTRRLPAAWDQVAAMHAFGPQLEVVAYTAGWTVRSELAAYADFTIMQAHAFDPFVPVETEPPYTSSVRARGYYFGLGGTALARLRIDRPGVELELEGRHLGAWSLDGYDRGTRLPDAPPTPQDLADQRTSGRATLALRPYDGPVGLAVSFDGIRRRGAWRGDARTTTELLFGLAVVYAP